MAAGSAMACMHCHWKEDWIRGERGKLDLKPGRTIQSREEKGFSAFSSSSLYHHFLS
jgi:hypothetical protein